VNNEEKAEEIDASGKGEDETEVASIPKVSKIIFDEEKGAVTLVIANGE
jgi:hypothetical protein